MIKTRTETKTATDRNLLKVQVLKMCSLAAVITLVLGSVATVGEGNKAYAKAASFVRPAPQQADIPIRVTGEHFKSLLGEQLTNVNVLVKGKQGIRAIPAQWTQLTDEGTVYSPEYKKIALSGDPLSLDADDRIEFMYQDAGINSCKDALNNLKQTHLTAATQKTPLFDQLVELKIQPNDQTDEAATRFVCLITSPAKMLQRSSAVDYVQYNFEQGEASSESYRLALSKENPLIWNDFYYEGVNLEKETGKTYGESILDSLKINIEAGVLSKFTKIHLDNTNLRTKVLEVQHGPIYDSMFALTKVKLAGATVFKMQVMMHFYPDHVEMKTRFKIPSVAKAIVRSPQVDVSLDANNMWGSQIRTSWGPKMPMLVDGKLDEQEKALTENEVSGRDSWIWYSTQRGFDLFTFIDFDKAFQLPIALVYDDDKTKEVQPERFVGQGPNVGYSIRGMVMGRYFTFNTNLLFSNTVESKDVESRVNALRNPWGIVSSSDTENKDKKSDRVDVAVSP